jgi:hypothetical protein
MSLGSIRGRRPRRLWTLGAAITALVVLGIVFVAGSSANLAGSTFEGNDGNLVVNTAGNTDWANAPNRVVGLDQPSGSTDNSFGQGTKEDDPNTTVVTGSIPPNKNDLTRFYIGSEFTSGNNYLYLAWERAVNIGNANLDLEINQNATSGFTGTTTGPVVLNRTAGDLLVTYDFGGSGTPTLGLNTWVTSGANSQCFAQNGTVPCWGNHVNLSAAGAAEGQVNTGTVTDPVPPNAPRTLTVGLFGEAAINLTAAGVFPAGTCEAFGSAFLKSRSSSSFGAEVKDFIAPQPVNISNCGRIKIIKRTDPRGVNQNFSYTSTIAGAQLSCVSDSTPASFTLNDNGNTNSDNSANTENCGNVPAGSYTVTEGADPASFVLESLTCSTSGTGGSTGSQDGTNPKQANITLNPGDTVTCVYVNQQQLGAIKITKTSSKPAGTALSGAHFAICTNDGPYDNNNPCTPAATGSGDKVTDSNGVICVDNLGFGDYFVTETQAPSGYAIDDATTSKVTVDNNAKCSDTTYVGESKSYTDTPLTDIVAKATSQVSGATKSRVTCVDSNSQNVGNSPQPSASTFSDPAEVDANGLKPGTYTCTIIIDP